MGQYRPAQQQIGMEARARMKTRSHSQIRKKRYLSKEIQNDKENGRLGQYQPAKQQYGTGTLANNRQRSRSQRRGGIFPHQPHRAQERGHKERQMTRKRKDGTTPASQAAVRNGSKT